LPIWYGFKKFSDSKDSDDGDSDDSEDGDIEDSEDDKDKDSMDVDNAELEFSIINKNRNSDLMETDAASDDGDGDSEDDSLAIYVFDNKELRPMVPSNADKRLNFPSKESCSTLGSH